PSGKKEKLAMTNHPDVLATSVDVTDVLRRLEALAEHWQHTAERFRVQWQESEWYLGETRATLVETQEQLASVRETYGWLETAYHEVVPQLEEAARQRDETNLDPRQMQGAQGALPGENLELTARRGRARRGPTRPRSDAAVRRRPSREARQGRCPSRGAGARARCGSIAGRASEHDSDSSPRLDRRRPRGRWPAPLPGLSLEHLADRA